MVALQDRLSLVLFAMIMVILLTCDSRADEQRFMINKTTATEMIDDIGKLLKEWYIYPDSAEKMIALLDKKVRDGKYDNITSPQDLASKLTEDIHGVCLDKHLVIKYDPSAVGRIRASSKSEPGEEAERDKKSAKDYEEQYHQMFSKHNFGFKKVEILPGNVGYLDFRVFPHTRKAGLTTVSALNFMAFTDAVILDLRKNPGGDNAGQQLVASYFIGCDDEVPVSTFELPAGVPYETFWSLPYVPGRELCDVDLYILTSSETFSAAEGFSGQLQALGRATIVGDTTRGGAHATKYLEVNDWFFIGVPYMRGVIPATGNDWEGIGIVPDVFAEPENALAVAHKMALSKSIDGNPDEGSINALGYKLLEENLIDVAVHVFKRNTELHPKSGNAFDSYAEACMMAGNNDLAIENYQKSLELSPDNENAIRMLKRLQE